MVSRRTRARLELLGSIIALAALSRHNRSSDTEPPSRPWMLAGFISMIPYLRAVDQDWNHIQSSYRQRTLTTFVWALIQQVLLPDEEPVRRGFSIGMLTSTIVYRLWHGGLRPLPSITHD